MRVWVVRRQYGHDGSTQAVRNPTACRLTAVRLLHTAAWAVFAGFIVAMPILARCDGLQLVRQSADPRLA
jgi:hypothetical protein